MLRKSLGLVLFALAAAGAWGQGSAGGYGQSGGGGGGAAPGRMRKPDSESEGGNRPENLFPGRWKPTSAIVTPGSDYAVKFKLKKGQVLFAAATSNAFDPALSFTDAKGATLVKNDDRQEGDQSPFIAGRAPEDGEYTVRVLSFRNAAGGQFRLQTVVLNAYDAVAGKVEVPAIEGKEDGLEPVTIVAFPGSAGQVIDVKPLRDPITGATDALDAVIGPSGVEKRDFQRIVASGARPIFRLNTKGTYWLVYSRSSPKPLSAAFPDVPVIESKAVQDHRITLAPGESRLIEFPVTENQILHTTIRLNGGRFFLGAPSTEETATAGGDPVFGNTFEYAQFLTRRGDDSDAVRVFHAAGKATLALWSDAQSPVTVDLQNTDQIPVLASGTPIRENLGIGQSRIYVLKSTKSELMHLAAESKQFQCRLDIFRLDGSLANTLVDYNDLRADDDLYFPEAETFLVRVICEGWGGSGPFTVERDSLGATPYALGGAQTCALNGQNFGLYSVDLKEGVRVQLTLETGDRATSVDLLDEDGTFLRSQAVSFGSTVVHYFVPRRSGKHRLWLRGVAGPRRFRLEVHTPPKLG